MRNLGRIGRFELRRQFAGFDRRSLLLVLLVGAALAVVLTAAIQEGVRPDRGLYRVESDADHVLLPAVQEDPRFDVTLGDGTQYRAGEAELWLHGDAVRAADTEKQRAALEALEQAVQAWLEDRMAEETDTAAAFPVQVNVIHELRPSAGAQADTVPEEGGGGDGTGGGTGGGDGSDRNATTSRPPIVLQDPSDTAQVDAALRPSEVEPPFPMRSLLLTFAYMVPMNLLGQTYSGALLSERVRGRGVMLLSAPASGATVLWGKSLPYALATLVLALVVSVWIGASAVGLLAALSFLAFLLAASALLGVTARNLRELTFFQVGLTTMTSLFLFLPAIFTALPPVAFLSPVHVVASTVRGEAVGLVPFLYATLPLLLAGAALAVLATVLYREETLFSPRTPGEDLLAGIGNATSRWWQTLLAGGLVVPFAYAAEILLVVFAVTLDLRLAFLLFLFGGAAIEEVLKALPAWAHHRKPLPPLRTGLLVGTGFFLVEKLALLLGLAGFSDLPFGGSALAAFGAGSLVLLLAPILLHSATAAISATGFRYGRGWGVVGVLAAIVVHAGYNAVVILGAGA